MEPGRQHAVQRRRRVTSGGAPGCHRRRRRKAALWGPARILLLRLCVSTGPTDVSSRAVSCAGSAQHAHGLLSVQ
eukprot:3933394-Rhodomonas_salina.4